MTLFNFLSAITKDAHKSTFLIALVVDKETSKPTYFAIKSS